jgi:hypothetical protein
MNLVLLAVLVGLVFRSWGHALFAPILPALLSVECVAQGTWDVMVVLSLTLTAIVLASFGGALRWPKNGRLLLLGHLSTLPYFCASAIFLAWATNS